jgi:hypothetical protein
VLTHVDATCQHLVPDDTMIEALAKRVAGGALHKPLQKAKPHIAHIGEVASSVRSLVPPGMSADTWQWEGFLRVTLASLPEVMRLVKSWFAGWVDGLQRDSFDQAWEGFRADVPEGLETPEEQASLLHRRLVDVHASVSACVQAMCHDQLAALESRVATAQGDLSHQAELVHESAALGTWVADAERLHRFLGAVLAETPHGLAMEAVPLPPDVWPRLEALYHALQAPEDGAEQDHVEPDQ